MKRLVSLLVLQALSLGAIPVQAKVALGRIQLYTTALAPGPLTGVITAPMANLRSLRPLPEPAQFAGSAVRLPSCETALPTIESSPAVQAASPVEVLRAVSVPETDGLQDAAFDGASARPAWALVEPPPQPGSEVQLPRNRLQRYRAERHKTPLSNILGKGMLIAALGTAVGPILWGAAPAMKLAYVLSLTSALMLAVVFPIVVALAAWRRLGGIRRETSRRARVAVAVAGILLGIGLAAVPYHVTGPVIEYAQSHLDGRRAVEERLNLRHISGGAVEDEVIKVLSQNPVGRDILNQLRDRGGVIHLPIFFTARQSNAMAEYGKSFDDFHFDDEDIARYGWTLEQFHRDPTLQRQLVRDNDLTVLHELVHAAQGRRPPWTPGYFKQSIEAEQEAFLREALYAIAQFEASPDSGGNAKFQGPVLYAADDLDKYLEFVSSSYPQNVVVGDPYFKELHAEQKALWPAYRVRIYQLLAASADTPAEADRYMLRAQALAKAAGLPEPSPLVVSR